MSAPPHDNQAFWQALWQQFFTAAQALTQRSASTAEAGMTVTKLGLHFRMRQLFQQLSHQFGLWVQGGPFKDMALPPSAEHMSGNLARWLGVYEHDLWPVVEAAVQKKYDTIINIGAGEGYYAVGMARRLPDAHIIAADINPEMQAACAAMATLNKVDGRVTVRGQVVPADFAGLVNGRTLIICDIEGAEEELLNPSAAPALLDCDFIIEMHDVYRPYLSQRLSAQYEKTHDIQIINAGPPHSVDYQFVAHLPELDRYLLTYEGREGFTPWGVFTRR